MDNFHYKRYTGPHAKEYSFYVSDVLEATEDLVDVSLRDTLLTEKFGRFTSAIELLVRESTGDLSFKLNSSDNDSIPVATGATFRMVGYPIKDIYITMASGVEVTLFLQGW